jgi:hypothetical protein
MTNRRLIRDYENPALPLEERLPSLARRFACLEGAHGLDPWAPELFQRWIQAQGKGSAAWHAGLLVLGLWDSGPWAEFDAIAAVKSWNEEERTVFATWVRSWKV